MKVYAGLKLEITLYESVIEEYDITFNGLGAVLLHN